MMNISETNHTQEVREYQLIMKNDIREVTKLSAFLKEVLEKLNFVPSVATQYRLAIEESVVNVMQYAYPIDTEGYIEVRIRKDGDRVKTMIVDGGSPFDPTSQKEPDTSLSAEERQIGGLGIHLMRKLVDAIIYERIEEQNVLTLVKELRIEN